jgi:hypothetical protein
MDINERLYVEIRPMEGPHIPHPHPIDEGGFDPRCVYKVLGMYNPSETSECYFVLSNPQRQIWFIPQRHLRAFGLIESDELMFGIDVARTMLAGGGESGVAEVERRARAAGSDGPPHRPEGNGNGHSRERLAPADADRDWPGRLQTFR